MSHTDKYNILYPFQHGFRKFRSCEAQLIEFIDDVNRNLDDGKQTDVLDLITRYAIVSSTKSLIVESNPVGMSLM
jgi:hypothetical protein